MKASSPSRLKKGVFPELQWYKCIGFGTARLVANAVQANGLHCRRPGRHDQFANMRSLATDHAANAASVVAKVVNGMPICRLQPVDLVGDSLFGTGILRVPSSRECQYLETELFSLLSTWTNYGRFANIGIEGARKRYTGNLSSSQCPCGCPLRVRFAVMTDVMIVSMTWLNASVDFCGCLVSLSVPCRE